MLRVYSILYTERLWNANHHDDNPIESTLTNSIYTPGICSQETNQCEVSQDDLFSENQEEEEQGYEGEEEEFVRDQAQVQTKQVTEEEEEEEIIPCHPYSIFEGIETNDIEIETSLNKQQNDEENLEQITTVTQEIFDEPISIVKQEQDDDDDDEILSIESLSSNNEQVVESLTIDTTVPIHETEEVHTATSLVSSSSTASSVPPKTPPSSNHSFLQTKSKTTSLLRRETTKLNDRRKSLTKKIKRVLNTNGPTKRFSI